MFTPYTVPKLVKYDDLDKTWYVFFRYNQKLFKKTGDINRIKNKRMRLIAGEQLAKAIHEKLKEGWNPNVPTLSEIEGSGLSFYQALEFALDKKKGHVENKTISTYFTTLKQVKISISNLNLAMLPIVDLKRVHVKTIMENAMTCHKWSNKAYNKHLGHVQVLLNELLQWDVIPYNPAVKMKHLRVEESSGNRIPTAVEHKRIKEFLFTYHKNFFLFILFIFDTGIRPVELTKVRLNMFDVSTRCLILPPTIVKNRRYQRVVQLSNWLWDIIRPMFDKDYPEDYFLFGSFRPSGEGNKGSHVDFIPGPTQLKRGTATNRWKKLIKDGLGINVDMYWYKRYGANMKILAGISIDALKEQYGHSSKLTTEIYATNVKEVRRLEIAEKSPTF